MDNNPPAGGELDPLYCDVFKDPINGTPDDITQRGCLKLRCWGNDVWNAWRKKYPVRKGSDKNWINTANFSDADFSMSIIHDGYIDFQGFIFGHGARFDGVKFGDDARFDGAQFGDDARFDGTQFGHGARFDGTQFGLDARFDGAQFGRDARFDGAQFGYNARYVGAQFGYNASFDGAQFGYNARFDGAQFGHGARFVAFTWALLTSQYSKRPGGLEAAKAWAEAEGQSPGSFNSIFFAGAHFAGQADFSGRTFEGPTSFGRLNYPITIKRRSPDGNVDPKDLPYGQPTVFGQAPLFHNCKFYQDTTFEGAKFPGPSGSDTAARAYRTLKMAFDEQKAAHEEQRFFRLEMAEESARASRSQRCLFRLYWLVSDYGFSLWRPMFLLVGALLVFLMIYGWLADLSLCLPWLAGLMLCLPGHADCHIRYDLLQFTLLQALPLPGLDKWSYDLQQCLFPKEGWQSAVLTLAVMFQKAISLLAIFLFGLALRNLFKMK